MTLTLQKVCGQFATKFTADESGRRITARINTVAVDRDNEVVLPSGFYKQTDRVKMLWNHNSSIPPIGAWDKFSTASTEIVARGFFATRPVNHPANVEWLPDSILHMVREGVLDAVSIGFIPDENSIRPPREKDLRDFGAKVGRIIGRWELLEVSVVPIGSNPEAMIVSLEKAWPGGSAILKSLNIQPRKRLLVVPKKALIFDRSRTLIL